MRARSGPCRSRPQKVITAEIFVVETGRELRIRYGTDTNLLLSALSRTGDEPLEARAAEFKEVLESKGWKLAVDLRRTSDSDNPD